MFKKRYQVLWGLNVEKLAQRAQLEMNSEGWLPLGGAVFADDSSGSTPRGWYQTMWLPEDPHTTGLVPGREEELLMEDDVEITSSLEFVGKPPAGDFKDD